MNIVPNRCILYQDKFHENQKIIFLRDRFQKVVAKRSIFFNFLFFRYSPFQVAFEKFLIIAFMIMLLGKIQNKVNRTKKIFNSAIRKSFETKFKKKTETVFNAYTFQPLQNLLKAQTMRESGFHTAIDRFLPNRSLEFKWPF